MKTRRFALPVTLPLVSLLTSGCGMAAMDLYLSDPHVLDHEKGAA